MSFEWHYERDNVIQNDVNGSCAKWSKIICRVAYNRPHMNHIVYAYLGILTSQLYEWTSEVRYVLQYVSITNTVLFIKWINTKL